MKNMSHKRAFEAIPGMIERKREGSLSDFELPEARVEVLKSPLSFGFELHGVRSHLGELSLKSEKALEDHLGCALISVLVTGQRLSCAISGGGGSPIAYRIQATAKDQVPSAQRGVSDDFRTALSSVLESGRSGYRFRRLSDRELGTLHVDAAERRYLIRPVGTVIAPSGSAVGFLSKDEEPSSLNTLRICPYTKSVPLMLWVPFIGSYPEPITLELSVEPITLSSDDERQLKAAQSLIRMERADNAFWSKLEESVGFWLMVQSGYRITCSVRTRGTLSPTYMNLIGRVAFPGILSPVFEMVDATEADHQRHRSGIPETLDLSNCYPQGIGLPRLVPEPDEFQRAGIKKFFNGETPSFIKRGVRLGAIRENEPAEDVRLGRAERNRHLYVLGATGTGKSTLLYNLAMQDIRNGEGVCLIDPHGDLYKQVRKSIPAHRADDVILFDPCNPSRVPGLNLLECSGPYRETQVNFVINEMFALFEKLYDMRQCGGPMFELYFRSALQLAMADPDRVSTLVDLPAVFEDRKYRQHILQRCGNSLLADFWSMAESASGEARLSNIAPYIVSKLNMFVHNALMRPIIGQPKSSVDFREVMDNRRILLVNLSKGALGEMDLRLLGMIILTKMVCAAMGRLNIAPERRKPFMVYVDEFQNFTTDASASLLSESRKFGLCLTLANQNLAQLSDGKDGDSILHSLLGNVGSTVFFRLGAPDASRMAVYTAPNFSPEDLQSLPNYHAAARLLTLKGPTASFVFETHPASRSREAGVQATIRRKQMRYTTLIKAVERDIANRRQAIRTISIGKEEPK